LHFNHKKFTKLDKKIRNYKKLLKFILNIYKLTELNNDIDTIIEHIPLNLIEHFIPLLVGFYVVHKEHYPYILKK
jgi:hypothetical protein